MKAIQGLGVALATPFKKDRTLDLEALSRLVQYCIDGGVDYLVAMGTTAESVTLNKTEKQQVLKTIIRANADKLPLVVGIGGNNTHALADELKYTDLAPFVAVLSVSPYYNRPTQEGIYRHYKHLAEVSAKPLILYNVPSRTGSNVLPETVSRLAKDCPNIAGVKEACGNLEQIKDLISQVPEEFVVLSGDDGTACETILNGGHGVISVLGQGLPEQFKSLVNKAREGDAEGARAVEKKLNPGIELIFKEGNPAGIKSLLNIRGICQPFVRLPLVEVSDVLKRNLENFSKEQEEVQA